MTGVRVWSNIIVIDNRMARLPIMHGLSSHGIARTKKLQAEDLLKLDPVHVLGKMQYICVPIQSSSKNFFFKAIYCNAFYLSKDIQNKTPVFQK